MVFQKRDGKLGKAQTYMQITTVVGENCTPFPARTVCVIAVDSKRMSQEIMGE